MKKNNFQSFNLNSILTVILISVSFLFATSCSVTNQYELAQLEAIKNKNTDKKIDTYFNLLSNISNDDISRTFELSYPQASALNALEAIKERKYIPIFVNALDNDSPIIRQAAINKMKLYDFKPSIPKLKSIMNDDPVQQIRFDAMNALKSLQATTICTDLVKIISKNENTQTVIRAINTLSEIQCNQTVALLINYFEADKFNSLKEEIQREILIAIPKTKSKQFIPYLVKITAPLKKLNPRKTIIYKLNSGLRILELEALQKLNETNFFINELSGNYNSDYKRKIIQYILKINTPKTDKLTVKYINSLKDSNERRLSYKLLQNEFTNEKRRKQFLDIFLKQYDIESNEDIKYKIITMLKGILQEKHIERLKLIFKQEENASNKCHILLTLATIPSKKHYNFMIKFDNKDEPSWCRAAVRRYKKSKKSSKSRGVRPSKVDISNR